MVRKRWIMYNNDEVFNNNNQNILVFLFSFQPGLVLLFLCMEKSRGFLLLISHFAFHTQNNSIIISVTLDCKRWILYNNDEVSNNINENILVFLFSFQPGLVLFYVWENQEDFSTNLIISQFHKFICWGKIFIGEAFKFI